MIVQPCDCGALHEPDADFLAWVGACHDALMDAPAEVKRNRVLCGLREATVCRGDG